MMNWRGLEGSSHDQIKVVSQHLPGRTAKKKKKKEKKNSVKIASALA
jgi:hypothetical protein